MKVYRNKTSRTMWALLMVLIIMFTVFPTAFGETNIEEGEYKEDITIEETETQDTEEVSAELEDGENQADVEETQIQDSEEALSEVEDEENKTDTEEIQIQGLEQSSPELADGEYQIGVTALQETNDSPSRSGDSLDPTAYLKVQGSRIDAFVTINQITDFKVKNNTGEFEAPEIYILDEAESKTTYRIQIGDIDTPITVQIYVAQMGRSVNFRIAFDGNLMPGVIPAPSPGQDTEDPLDPSELADGEYQIGVTALQETNDSPSRSGDSLDPTAYLKVQGSRIDAFVTINQITDFKVKNNTGEFEAPEIYILDEAESKTTYRIQIGDIDTPITVQIYVAQMGRSVNFRIAFDGNLMPGVIPAPSPGQDTEDPLDPSELADGEYQIGVTALQETNDSPSRSGDSLDPIAYLKVEGGRIDAFVTMGNSQQRKDFKVQNSLGEFHLVEIYAEDETADTKTYKFEVQDFSTPVMVQMYVLGMGTSVKFRIAFDKESLSEVISNPNPDENPNPGGNPNRPLDPTKLEDGEYRIGISAIQETNNSPSRVGDSLEATAYLKVQNSRIYAFVTMGNSDQRGDFKVRNSSGSFQLADIYAENGQVKTKTYKFEVQDLNTPVMVEVYVPAMGFAPKFRILFDTATLAKAQVPSPQFTTVQTNFSVTGNTVKFNVTPSLAPNSSKAVATVAKDVLERAFDQIRNNKETKIAQIVIEKVQGTTAYEIVIPASYLSSDTGNRKIEIQTELGWVLLPENLLDASQKTNAGDAIVTIQAADKSKLDNTMKQAIGNKPIIEITLKVRGNTVAWSNAAAPVSISVPYKPTTEELEEEEGITVWYIDGHFGDIMWANGLYDSETEVVTFTTLTESDTTTSTTKIIVTPVLEENATKAIATISLEMLEAAFSQFAEENEGQKIVEIEIEKLEEVDAYEISLPANYLSLFSNQHKIEVQTYLGTILLSGNMLDYLGDLDNEEVTLSIQAADKSNLPQAILTAVGNRPVLEINLKVNHQIIPWRNPATPVRISIPYSPTAEELKNPEHMAVWYINPLGNGIAIPSGRYDAASDRVIFTTTHFSKYAVVKPHRSFDDIQGLAWARNPIEVLAAKGIISGTSNNTFTPESSISRADYMIMLAKTLELTGEAGENFQDVKKADYFYKHVGVAKNLGITGEVNREFHPNTAISRQDMAVFTQNALKKANRVKTTEVYDTTITFIEEYLLTNEGKHVDPNQSMTRAEAAVFLYEFYNRVYPVAKNIKTPISSESEAEEYEVDVNALDEVSEGQLVTDTDLEKPTSEAEEHRIGVIALQETNDNPSRAGDSLSSTAYLKVKEGKTYALITMSNSSQRTDFKVKNSLGEFILAEIYAEDGAKDTKTYKIEITDIDTPVTVQMYVTQMGMPVNFRIMLDKETLSNEIGIEVML